MRDAIATLPSLLSVSNDSVLQGEPAAPDPTIRVLAAVVERGGRFLICQRPLHKRHGGLWEFPGGKCEPGESDADAARRELQEELGVAVTEVGRTLTTAHDAGSPYLIAFVPVQFDADGNLATTGDRASALPKATTVGLSRRP